LFGAVAGPAPVPGAAEQPAASALPRAAVGVAAASVIAASAAPPSFASSAVPALRIPRELMDLLQRAACYRAEDRWAFLYKILWRWQQGRREVMSMADDDGNRLHGMARAARRRSGANIPIAPEKAQPESQQPHTLEECRRCELWEHATQAVPGEGAQKARIMLVGEQPGDQEDLQGHPFVGPAGALLDRALAQAGLDRSKVYVTNAVKHFKWEPRGKRRLHKTPAQKEILACHYWLEGELEQVAPQVVVALGGTALKDYMDQPVQHAGRWVVATYHPAYVLRVPGADAKDRALAAMVAALRAAAKIAYE